MYTSHTPSFFNHGVQTYSRELNAVNNVKHDKQKRNRIIDDGGMELVHCICDCVHNVLEGNIPVNDKVKKRLERHKDCLRKLVNKKTSNRKRKHLIQERGFLESLIPTLVGLCRIVVHWTIMDEMKNLLIMDSRTFSVN